MTTPTAVATQPNVPSKSGIGPVRDAGAKDAPGAKSTDGQEQGFGDVLSELQQGGSEPAPSKGSPMSDEWANARLADTEAHLSPEAGASDPKGTSEHPGSGSDPQVSSQADGAEGVQPDPLGLNNTLTNGMAGAAALNLVQPPAKNEPGALPTAPHTGSAVEAGETANAKVRPPEAWVQLHAEATAKGELDNVNSADLGSDSMLARLGPGETDKDKSERPNRSRRPALAMGVPMSQATNAALAQRSEVPVATQRPKANVLGQETHFAPVLSSAAASQATAFAGDGVKSGTGPDAADGEFLGSAVSTVPSFEDSSSSTAMPLARQIADRVAAEATSAPEFAERTGMAPPMQQVMKPALKILQIQLQPADLGTVTVRMELKDTELTLHVETDRKGTADLIRNDQDTLTNLLRSAGYNVDTGSVRILEGDRTLASQQSGQQSTQANLQSSTQSQAGASDRQEHAQRGDKGGDTGQQTGRNNAHETATNRTGLGVYV